MSQFTRLLNTMKVRKPYGVTVHAGEMAVSSKSGKSYPKANDFFTFKGMFEERCRLHYGATPRLLNICFPKARPEESCLITQEGQMNGSVLSRATIDWWQDVEEKPERYEIFNYKTQLWDMVDEAAYIRHNQQYNLDLFFNLRLSFWLQELMADGIDCLCQLNTKADDSSIPTMTHILENMHSIGRLQMYPFKLTIKWAEGKGLDTHGEMKGKKYPVINLFMDSSEESLRQQQQAIDGYLHVRQILPISREAIQALNGQSVSQNALNAAPEHTDAIDAEHVEVTDTIAIDEEIAELVERGSLLIQQSANPQIETWWTGVLQQRDLTKLRAAVAGLEKKAAEKAALKPEHLDQPQPADVITSPQQEG